MRIALALASWFLLGAAPAVRPGDRVTLRITAGRVAVVAPARARGEAKVGEEVYVDAPGGRVLRAKVVAPGSVEVAAP